MPINETVKFLPKLVKGLENVTGNEFVGLKHGK